MYLLLCRPSACENAGHHQPGQLRCGSCPARHYAFGQQYPDPGPSCSQASIPLTCCYESMPLSELMTHSIVTLWQIGDRKSCCATPKVRCAICTLTDQSTQTYFVFLPLTVSHFAFCTASVQNARRVANIDFAWYSVPCRMACCT